MFDLMLWIANFSTRAGSHEGPAGLAVFLVLHKPSPLPRSELAPYLLLHGRPGCVSDPKHTLSLPLYFCCLWKDYKPVL